MNPPTANQWNRFDENTALRGRNKPAPPTSSWWLNLDRGQFAERVKVETPRMSASNLVGKVTPIIAGGQ